MTLPRPGTAVIPGDPTHYRNAGRSIASHDVHLHAFTLRVASTLSKAQSARSASAEQLILSPLYSGGTAMSLPVLEQCSLAGGSVRKSVQMASPPVAGRAAGVSLSLRGGEHVSSPGQPCSPVTKTTRVDQHEAIGLLRREDLDRSVRCY